MKKGLIVSLIAVFVLTISSFVLAEDLAGKSSIGVDLSYFSCDGWDDDEWDQAGLMVEAKYRYFVNENVAIGGSVGYWSSSEEITETYPYSGTMSRDMTLTIIPIMVNATYFFNTTDSKIKPYIDGGLGLFNAKIEWDEEGRIYDPWDGGYWIYSASGSDSASPIGFRIGGGVEYQVSPKVSLTGNLKYQILSIDFEDVDDDCDANGLIIGAGVNLLF